MNFPNITNVPCLDTSAPPPDNRCSDPAFALAHPEVCGVVQVLALKPGILLTCMLGSVKFRAFVEKSGAETEVTSGLVFTSSNPDVAVVGAISGSATGVSAGTVIITATWQGLTAKATLTVLGVGNCCSINRIATELVVDVSKSMSMAFGGGYSTRLDFAKAAATRYSNETNTQKDTVGLVEFDSSPSTDEPLGTGLQTMAGAIDGLLTTPNLTSLGLGLEAAISALNASSAAYKVIVLFSDGEDKDPLAANDPLAIAAAFKNDGGIIITVGVRAHDVGWTLMNELATGGFFLNAYPSVAQAVLDQLSGLKGFICAGNCAPPGDVFESVGALNYTGFANWDVTAGHVDLIGPGLYDLLPGNGFYVDMAGSSLGFAGELTSKTTFAFQVNKTYRLSFYLAGNQRKDLPNYKLRVKIGDGGILLQEIGMPDYTQDFTKFSFSFTPAVALSGKLVFTQLMGLTADNAFGLLLDNIMLENTSNGVVLFSDTFDTENFIYVPPACGSKTVGYGGGGNPVANPPALTLVAGGDITGAIADPAAPTAAGNISPGIADPTNANSVLAGGVGTGSLPVGITWYNVSWVTASGETKLRPNHIGFSQATTGKSNILSWSVSNDPLDAAVTAIRIWREYNGVPRLRFTILPNNLAAQFEDTFSEAQFAAFFDSSINAPTSNTTGTSPGDMTPGDVVKYAVSWLTVDAYTETNLSPVLTTTVPANCHSLIITLPTSVPPSVTGWRLWRYGDNGGGLRFYLLDADDVSVLTYTDLFSQDEFGGNAGSTPAPPQSNTTGTSNHPGDVVVGVPTQYAISYVTATGETALSPSASITLATGYSSIEVRTILNPASVTSKRLWRYYSGRYYLLTVLSPSAFNYYDLMSDAEFFGQVDAAILPPSSNTTGTTGSYFTYYGYNCYGAGCLGEGLGSQLQDPNPLADIEANYTPPKTYTSTKSFTAQCPAGSAQASTTSAVPVMTSPTAPSGTVIFDARYETAGYEAWRVFGTGPAWRSPYRAVNNSNLGLAAMVYGFPTPKIIVSIAITSETAYSGLIEVRGGTSFLNNGIASRFGIDPGTILGSFPSVLIAAGERKVIQLPSPNSYPYYYLSFSNSPGTVQITRLELFEAGTSNDGVTKTSTKTSTISQADADAKALDDATTQAYAALTCATQYVSNQFYKARCATGSFGLDSTQFATATSLISQADADANALADATALATAGLNCTLSNNDQAITINDLAPATPYPSVKYISGLTGLTTKVVVNIIGFAHQYPSDAVFFLRAPTGEVVMLFQNTATTGGADLFNVGVTGINLTFDDAAGSALAQHATIVAGTYKPTKYGVSPTFTAPAPAGPYPALLSTFNGKNPNGSWSLWCQDFKGLDVGSIAGGWTLTISSS